MEHARATLRTVAGRPVLRFERHLAHPQEKVWKAITDPDEMAHWFPARVETELKVGATMRFRFDGMDVADTEGEIVEVDPPQAAGLPVGGRGAAVGADPGRVGLPAALHAHPG
ncbi:MAG: SRPBCC domain-containing protein [Streptomycetales bacterium]